MSPRIPSNTMADELDRMVEGKSVWLAKFTSGKTRRPDWEIETRQRECEVLRQAAADYRKSAGRDAEGHGGSL